MIINSFNRIVVSLISGASQTIVDLCSLFLSLIFICAVFVFVDKLLFALFGK